MPTQPSAAAVPPGRPSLDRVLDPKSVAIVGASETSRFAANSLGTLDSDADVFYVHPRHDTVFGQPTYPTLQSIGKPVDAVLSLLSAERTTDLAGEAAACGA